MARSLLLDLAEMGVPAGQRVPRPHHAAVLADLVSWGAIGARTTESQLHRELATGLSCRSASRTAPTATSRSPSKPSCRPAIRTPSSAITKDGQSAIVATGGNPDCHVILRGGRGVTELRRRRRASASPG